MKINTNTETVRLPLQGHLLVALNFVVGGGFKVYPHIYEPLVVVGIRF